MNQTHSLPGPDDITRFVLPNGITLLLRSNFNSPSVTLHGYLPVGSLFDPDEKLGLSDFATSSLMRGTETRSFEQIFDSLESVGAVLGFSAGTHTTSFSARSLMEDLPLIFDLLADCLRQPVFPPAEVKKLRSQLLTGLAMRAQSTGDMAAITFDKLLFRDHPYARPDDGYPKTIRAIQRDDLADFHRRCFGPAGMTLAIVGAVDPARVRDQVEEVLGDWVNPLQPAPPALPELLPLSETVRQHVPLAGKSQSDLLLGVLGPRRRSPDYPAASLGNSILGQFGMMGRIGDVVRERSGLAYYASSNLSAGLGPGSWEVSAGVNPSNLEKALDLIIRELKLFTENGVTQEELSDSQDNFVGRLPLSLESNAGVAAALINLERFDLGLDYYRKYEGMIRAITPAMVVEAARRYINPSALAIATCGP